VTVDEGDGCVKVFDREPLKVTESSTVMELEKVSDGVDESD
jgi:hypothetical protein